MSPPEQSGLTDYASQLARIETATSDELARIEAAYREIQRRDGAAWWHARAYRRLVLPLIASLLACCAIIATQAYYKGQVQAFVQTVQLTEDGRLVLVGIPMDLLAYAPQDAEWMDMLAEWVRRYRWRGDEDSMTRTKVEWDWLKKHTCGIGSTQLLQEEKTNNPYKIGKRTSVEIKAITKTQTPTSYQVEWFEVVADKGQTTSKTQRYIGTFTVGRLRPTTMAEVLENRLGLCVNGYDLSPKGGS